LKKEWENTDARQLALVHPKKHLQAAEWIDRLYQSAADIRRLVPPTDSLILIGGDEMEDMVAGGRRVLPFIEDDELHEEAALDDSTAIRDLERLRQAGASFLVFVWPAFWWLDYYPEFHRHLRSTFRCALQNDRVVVF